MAGSICESNPPLTRIGWVWNGNENPFDKLKTPDWKNYSDVENLIIEEAYAKKDPHAMLDHYHIDFRKNLQISNDDPNKQRQVKRITRNRDSHLREDRFTFTPLDPKQPFAGLYAWISPFIKEIVKDFNITKEKLPSKDQTTLLMVIDKAAAGIVEEAKLLGRRCEGEKLAKMLLSQKQAGAKEVWNCCAYLYSLQCFLYKKLNETMRLIGSQEHEHIWRSKVRTLGPFALLLWDNPSNNKPSPPGITLYRGAFLTPQVISAFIDDCSKEEKPMRSFPSFTSCSRIEKEANKFGNALFIMNVKHAFTVDIKPFSDYPHEEEELLSPGCCFIVQQVSEKSPNKFWIYVDLIQQHSQNDIQQLSSKTQQPGVQDLDRLDENPYYLDDYRIGHANDWIQ